MAERLLDETEGRHMLGNLGRTKYFELIKAKELRSVKVGRRRMVPVSEVQRYIERQMADQPDAPDAA